MIMCGTFAEMKSTEFYSMVSSLPIARAHSNKRFICNHMGQLRPSCTVWGKKSKKIKVNMKELWVVYSIELHSLYVNQVFSQLSGFTVYQKRIFLKPMCFGGFLQTKIFKIGFKYYYYISIERFFGRIFKNYVLI